VNQSLVLESFHDLVPPPVSESFAARFCSAPLPELAATPIECRRPDRIGQGRLLVDEQGNRITTSSAWERRRSTLKEEWLNVIRPLPVNPLIPPRVTVLGEERFEGLLRQHLSYEVEPGEVVEAYLMKPDPCPKACPGVAVFHSTVNHSIRQPAGLADDREKAFGLKLARKGMVTLSPRNFLWPTNEKIDTQAAMAHYQQKHPQHTGMARMLLDSQIAVTLLAHDPDVDPARIGSVGHSLGAKEVLYLAAFDERVKVTVSSEGGIGIPFSNWEASWYLGDQVKQPGFPREHHELLALIAPRPFLLVGGDSADGDQGWPFITSARQVYDLYPGPARLGQYNHKLGHKVPPAAEHRIDDWLTTYL
jgi:hypothetical protein